ncbi:MAG: hypothetical protein P4L82_14460 [Ancalomicrobiaceae bacterium]|nr:hypothetical protein [Ancalomicrobiaceae bacterium]
MLNAKDAISRAKSYIADVFSEEKPTGVGLEEIEYDEQAGAWIITVGFFRAMYDPNEKEYSRLLAGPKFDRTYKKVTVGQDGEVISVKNRFDS